MEVKEGCSLQPADSISVAQSAVTCACTDSKAGRLPVSEAQQQHTHNWICSGPESSPGFYGRAVNRLIITSGCLRIEVTGRDFTVFDNDKSILSHLCL